MDFQDLEDSLGENDQLRDLSHQASQDVLFEKLKEMPSNPDDRYCRLEGDNEDSPPRYQPKQVHMPEIDSDSEDYEEKLMKDAIANKAAMQ